MTEVAAGVPLEVRQAAYDTVSGDAEEASAELNGAIVLHPRRTRAPRTPRDAALRARLVRLHDAAVVELERRRAAADLEPADHAPVPIHRLSSITRELPRLAAQSPRLAGAVADAVRSGELAGVTRALATHLRRRAEIAERNRRGQDVIDEFGFDEEWTEVVIPAFRWLYRNYWRVRAIGVNNVPASGRALLVSNHSGVLPYDGAMIRTAIWEEHSAPRHARALILNAFFAFPFASWFLRRTGNTLGHPDDALRLLQRDELVLVFPEGAKGTGKPYSERYRLRRFGRGGFAQAALRTGSPIVPVSVVGSEEIHPMIADVRPLAELLGLPYMPVTPTFPWLGPLGLVPLPSSWIIEFHEPIHLDGHPPEAADDAGLVMHLADRVRDTIQAGLFRNLQRRGSVFAEV